MFWDLADSHTSDQLTEAADALADAYANLKKRLVPVTHEQIASALDAFAEMLQVTVPSPTGLKLYFHALDKMPAYKFEAACTHLAATHKWPRLPLPADFHEAAKDQRQDIDLFKQRIRSAHSTVNAARRLLHARSK